MSTRAALFIPNEPEHGVQSYKQIYCHYDGYPSNMIPALEAHPVEDIIAAKELRQITVDRIDGFEDPREIQTVYSTRAPSWAEYCYVYRDGKWS